MRFLALALLLPSFANAAGWTDFHGKTGLGEEIIITNQENVTVQKQGDEESYVQHFTADIVVKSTKGQKKFEKQNCISSSRPDDHAWLTCSNFGTSPLAGVTYHRFPPKEGEKMLWACITNCGQSSPQILEVDPWE